ncbi:ThiF family adenylyltransferase [Piscinibacter koreensis]|uniref:ThiF family adenylyltransferase n=1 Tax=Piscinibacter koreensis TaxID=2742824 RepID=A0A7Y6NSS7_9BURK|nr:ThiF family adenylyltransferase [Schlegelella koreensis]NUZ08623.1 ThiF family adenylyltransferase [Schlegelella koreensis]
MSASLTLTARQRAELARHLLPEDGCEAVAILLCGMARGGNPLRLLVRQVHLIPHEACDRRPDAVTWPTELIVPWLEVADKLGLAVVKIHGHRGYDRFSQTDDESDRLLFPSLYAWVDRAPVHASAILMDDGRLFGRVVSEDGQFQPLQAVHVIGDDIERFDGGGGAAAVPEHGRRIAQTFGGGTFERLRRLKVGVVGCSGTGSPVIEQLARNCIGSLVLVDPDHVEDKNLNRIANTTRDDAEQGRLKVDVAARAIAAMGLGTTVQTLASTLFDPVVVRELASCDVLFGCMDTIDGRHLLNKLATFYLIPYFDLGVKIEADGMGGVNQVCGSVHYLQPGGSSLLSRHVYSLEQVRAAGMMRTDPQQYQRLLDEGYLRGVQEDRPAVVQLNTLIASLAVNEFLARLHPYRLDPNAEHSVTRISLSHGIFEHEADGQPCPVLSRHAGRGDVEPLLDWPELSGGA